MKSQNKTHRNPSGFSLIELLITVAIVGILAAVAIPTYQAHFLRANRYQAISELLNIELAQERYYSANHRYAASLEILGLPTIHGQYGFVITLYSETQYQVKAEPLTGSRQWGDQKSGTQCAILTINQTGLKEPSLCWER